MLKIPSNKIVLFIWSHFTHRNKQVYLSFQYHPWTNVSSMLSHFHSFNNFQNFLKQTCTILKLTLCASIEHLRLAWHKIHTHKFTIHINKINSHNVESHYTQKFSSYINKNNCIPNKTSFVISFESLEILYQIILQCKTFIQTFCLFYSIFIFSKIETSSHMKILFVKIKL